LPLRAIAATSRAQAMTIPSAAHDHHRCGPPLVDPFGRRITYLRVSLTDRCDLRCRYCMAEEMAFAPRAELLTLEEIDAIASAFVARGVRRVRLTGGEPLVRRGALDLAARLGRHLASGALDELTLTTNGMRLADAATALAAAGVRRVNVSLDTLDAAMFRHITRHGDLARALRGVAAAKAAGLHVKLNMVMLRGLNEHQVEPMLQFCAAHGHDLTLIETMPMGEVETDRTEHYLPLTNVREMLAERYTLEPAPERTGGPARYVRVRELGVRLGFITPLTGNFCEGCNRVRLSAFGRLYLCLGQADAADLRAVVRARPGDAPALDSAIDAAIARKPRGHDFAIDRPGERPAQARHMSVTGG
jgi:cyclic pyranopterin phosphate synthase